jgi:hypothetical protein
MLHGAPSWDAVLLQLAEAPTPQLRSEAIDQMTELLQQTEWALPEGRAAEVGAALRERLADSNWCAPRPGERGPHVATVTPLDSSRAGRLPSDASSSWAISSLT